MEYLIVLILILVGAVLVLMEFLVFPGVNVVGLLGFVCIGVAVYMGYALYGSMTGHLILLGTACAGIAVTLYVLRSRTWRKLSLDACLDGSVGGVEEDVHVGDEGICIGRLAPMGNVKIGEKVVEAESVSGYVDAHGLVVVVKVTRNKVMVKLKNDRT